MMTRLVAAFAWFAAGAVLVTAQPQDSPQPRELAISLRQAVDLATAPDGNARVALAAELVEQANSQSNQSRAALLPHVEGSVSQQSIVRNLEAVGFQFDTPPFPGFNFPVVVGPFDVFDARLSAT